MTWIIRQLTRGFGKIDGRDMSVFWVDIGKSYVTERGFHCRVPGDDWTSRHTYIVIVIEYQAEWPDSAQGTWVVVSSMYDTHLKHGSSLPYQFQITSTKFQIDVAKKHWTYETAMNCCYNYTILNCAFCYYFYYFYPFILPLARSFIDDSEFVCLDPDSRTPRD